MKIKYTTKKFDGDDMYSWAVFKASDVKGMRSPIFYGQARPVCTGMSRSSAQALAKRLTAKSTEAV